MALNHVIRKVVLELHADSQQQIGMAEESFRQILSSMIIPAIEKYCDGIQQAGSVIRLDKLELDLGNVNIASLKMDIQKGIDVFLEKHREMAVRGGDVIDRELSDLESLFNFLNTGLLPWHVQGSRNNAVKLLFEGAVRNNKGNAVELLRFTVRHLHALRRLLAHVDDHLLWNTATMICSQQNGQFVDAGHLLLKYCGKRLRSDRRIFLWRTLIRFLSDGNTKPEIFLNQFVEVYAAACHVGVTKLRDDILGAVHAGDVSHKESIVVLLNAVRQFSGDQKLSFALMENEFYQLHDSYSRHMEKVSSNHRWLISLQTDLVRIMFEYAHSSGADVQRAIKERLLESLALFSPNSASGIVDTLRDALWQELGTMGAYTKSIQTLLQKVDAYGKDRHPVVQTIGNLLRHSQKLHTSAQFFLFLDRIEQVIAALPNSVYEADIGLWLQDLKRELLRQRMSGAAKNEFMQLLADVKRLCDAEEHGAVNKFLRQLLDAFSDLIASDKSVSFRQILNQIDNALQSQEAIFNKELMLESLSSLADKGVDAQSEAYNAPEEIYVSNAGLVLLAPFLRELFSDAGLVEGSDFNNADDRSVAMALLYNLVWPDETWREYDAALIKILCGVEITAECVTLDLQESVKLHTNELLQKFLQTEQVFRNVSLEGFRNAFLLREGVLRFHGNHAVLVVNRETFDVVLDKIGWDYHLVRYTWMKLPLMIEW